MNGHIETACFHCSDEREMIYASKKDAEWILQTSDIKAYYGKLFDKESGTYVLLLSPTKTGMTIVIGKMISDYSGDNTTVYLFLPYGLNVSGDSLEKIIFDVISSLEQNKKDVIISCLSSISKKDYEIIPNFNFNASNIGNDLAYRKVVSNSTLNQDNIPLSSALNGIFQDYYTAYKYIFLAIDGQHIANPELHSDISSQPTNDWRDIKKENKKDDDDSKSSPTLPEEVVNITEQMEEQEDMTEYSSEWLKSNTEIRGWLLFFFFAIIVGGIISAIYPIVTFKSEEYADNIFLISADILTGISMLAVALYTVFCFDRRKPNAVFWGRTYVILVFLTNLINLIGGTTEGTGLQSTSHVIRGLIWGGVWFMYLTFSEQVKEIIPKAFRKVSKIDWGILASIIIVPSLLVTIGFYQINSLANSRMTQETELTNTVLAQNERTDGRVIFTIPDKFECNSQDVTIEGNTVKIFTIKNDSIGSCTICSDYDSDKSRSNFDNYWNNWKDNDEDILYTDNVDSGTIKINGNDCLYKISKHYVNGVYIYWRFYLLFSPTGKVFLASFYDIDKSTEYVNELLNSVRFK